MLRIVVNLIPPGEISSDRLPQSRQPQIRSVAGFALLEREDGCLTNSPRGNVVRFSDSQRNDIGHRLDHFEKVSDTRPRDGQNVIRDESGKIVRWIHGVTGNRSTGGGWLSSTPFCLYVFNRNRVAVAITPSTVLNFSETKWAICLRFSPSTMTARSYPPLISQQLFTS